MAEFDRLAREGSSQPALDEIPDSWHAAWDRLHARAGRRIQDSSHEHKPQAARNPVVSTPPPSSPSSRQYEYRRLRGADEHRVLLLHPAESYKDEIRASLIYIVFSGNIPEYEALSYVCGDATKNRVAVTMVDGDAGAELGTVQIGQNLAVALRHLRFPDKGRMIWCDALCIYQLDEDEKSIEILNMSDIYHRASRVVVWLGPEADDSRAALRTLSHLGRQVQFSWDWSTFGMADPPKGKDPRWSYINFHLPFDNDTWRAVRMLMSRAWFQRLWVWQEATLADEHTAIVVCGYDEISWDHFRRAAMCLYYNNCAPGGMTEGELSSYKQRMRLISNLLRCKIPTTILGLFAFTRQCQCYDQRDRVYAILSFQSTQSSLSNLITPDYRKGKVEVFMELFQAYRTKNPFSLKILMFCGKGMGDTPTWVPDWAVTERQRINLQGWASGRAAPEFTMLGEGKALAAAIPCGTIKTRSPIMPSQASRERLLSTIRSWVPTNLAESIYPTGGSSLDAFASMLVHGMIREAWPEPPFIPTLRQARLIMSHHFLPDNDPSAVDMHYGPPQWYSSYFGVLEEALPGYGFMETSEGFYGLAPEDAMPDDEVYVVLGCQVPLILRQNDDGEFAIVGHGYVQGYMEGEALLGRLPSGWRVVYQDVVENGMWFDHEDAPSYTRRDPRAGELPSGWRESRYQDGQQCWLDTSTREYSWPDPRQTVNSLQARGIHVRHLILV